MDPNELIQGSLIHRGAEADLYLTRVGPWNAIVQQRVPKRYRHRDRDHRIRRERTVSEASIMSEARKAGVRTPTVLSVDPEEYSLSVSFIEGVLVRDELDK